MKLSLLFLLLLATKLSLASDFYLAENPLPENVKTVQAVESLPNNPNAYKTDLGVTSRCYKGKTTLVLSTNDLGQGYEFREMPPEKVKCLTINKNKTFSNKANISLYTKKEDVLRLLNAPQTSDKATLLYNQKKTINGKSVDEQVWVDVEFNNNLLVRLSVFASITQ